MKPYKTKAYINSLNTGRIQSTEMDEITVLEKRDTHYVVDYNGVKCKAIFNLFTCCYYVDDIYGRIEE